ncbi:MAG: hypothetical protein K2Y71_04375 [Xanthobacteraceae bacterium]|nr:hypothetical protein [Xanthobacteraceae bacterium]
MNKKIAFLCVAAATIFAGATDSMAAGNVFTRGCAARDMQVMMMLNGGSLPPHKMNAAVRNVAHARMMCFDGYVMDALALYDDIANSIASDYVLSSGQ